MRVGETRAEEPRGFCNEAVLTCISVKLIFMCETTDAADGGNGVGEALYSPSVSYRLSDA